MHFQTIQNIFLENPESNNIKKTRLSGDLCSITVHVSEYLKMHSLICATTKVLQYLHV